MLDTTREGSGWLWVREHTGFAHGVFYDCDHEGRVRRRNPLSAIRLVAFESEAGLGKIHAAEQVIGYDQNLQ